MILQSPFKKYYAGGEKGAFVAGESPSRIYSSASTSKDTDKIAAAAIANEEDNPINQEQQQQEEEQREHNG